MTAPRPRTSGSGGMRGSSAGAERAFRTKSIEEVVLVRRAANALNQQESAQRPGKGQRKGERRADIRKMSAGALGGAREEVHAYPFANRPRTSVHPMQGSILSTRPKPGLSDRGSGDTLLPPALGSQRAGGWVADMPQSAGGLTSSSTQHMAQMYRNKLIRTPDNALRRSTGWNRESEGVGREEGLHDHLYERLETLASRLGDVDQRSLRLQELMQQTQLNPGDIISGSESPYPPVAASPTSLSAANAGEPVRTRGWSASADQRRSGALDQGGTQLSRLNSSLETRGAEAGTTGFKSSSTRDDIGHKTGETEGEKKPKAPKSFLNLLDGIKNTVVGLDYIFIKATQSEHAAATKITKTARGYLRRKKYHSGMQALRAFTERQSHGMVVFFENYLEGRRHIHAQINSIQHRRATIVKKENFEALAQHVWAVMPTRINQRQRAYFMTVRSERRLQVSAFMEWKQAMLNLRGRAEVVAKNQGRYRRMRDKVELEAEKQGWRQELVESVVQQELQEEAVMLMTGRRITMAIGRSVRQWMSYVVRQKERRRKVAYLCAKRGHRSSFGIWKEYIKECKRWDPGRYVRLRNERALQLQALQYTYKTFYSAWMTRAVQTAESKRRAKKYFQFLCHDIFLDWHEEGAKQRRLKLEAIERWILTCRAIVQTPFRKWYLWVADSLAKQHAQGLIADMLRRRWTKMRFKRFLKGWWGETESGSESGRGREELLSLLNEKTEMNNALQQSVSRYKELHNKTESGLRKHEDLLAKREKQMLKVEKERADLSLRLTSSEQEVTRLRDMLDKNLSEAMIRKAEAIAQAPPPPTFHESHEDDRLLAALHSDEHTEEAQNAPTSSAEALEDGIALFQEQVSPEHGSAGRESADFALTGAEDDRRSEVGHESRVPSSAGASKGSRGVADGRGADSITASATAGEGGGWGEQSRPASDIGAASGGIGDGNHVASVSASSPSLRGDARDGKDALRSASTDVQSEKEAKGTDASTRPPSSSKDSRPRDPSTSRAPSSQAASSIEARTPVTRNSNMLTAPAPLPRIPGFSPAPTPDSIASARTPIPHNPTPPARRRAASFSFDPNDIDVPLADTLLVARSKHLMDKLHQQLQDDNVPPASAKLVAQMLEVLENGTESGRPITVSGARLSINAPEIKARPRRLDVAPSSLDSLNWNQLVVGLDRFDPKKKLAMLSSSSSARDSAANFTGASQARAQEQLVGRIMKARDARTRTLYSNA